MRRVVHLGTLLLLALLLATLGLSASDARHFLKTGVYRA